MNGKRVEFQKSVKTCNDKLTKQPKKTDFGSLLGPLLGAMLRQNGPPKLSKVTFFEFFTHPKSMHFYKEFLGSLWDPLGTVLGPFWIHFGKVLEAKIDANIDPDENVKNAFSPRRESKNQDLNASKKHQKSMPKRLARHVAKKFPKLGRKSPKIVPRGSQEASKRRSKSDFNLKSWKFWGPKAVLETTSKKSAKKQQKDKPVLANEREARWNSEKRENV